MGDRNKEKLVGQDRADQQESHNEVDWWVKPFIGIMLGIIITGGGGYFLVWNQLTTYFNYKFEDVASKFDIRIKPLETLREAWTEGDGTNFSVP